VCESPWVVYWRPYPTRRGVIGVYDGSISPQSVMASGTAREAPEGQRKANTHTHTLHGEREEAAVVVVCCCCAVLLAAARLPPLLAAARLPPYLQGNV